MKKITVIGGDCRQLAVAEEFCKTGNHVNVFGFDKEYTENFICEDNLPDALSESDVVILGLPSFSDEKTVNTPLYSNKIYIDDLICSLNKNAVIAGGMLDKEIINTLKMHCKGVYDYFRREELIINNVIPTVEGAIAIAINETPITLHKSKVLITGYGRIGKYLSRVLSFMGCDVTVSARKNEDFAWINLNGFKSVKTSELAGVAGNIDIIFNTVPDLVIGKEVIDLLKKEATIIDLASKPGGCDLNHAKHKGIKTIWALSLPGKTAPVTAGKIIKETVENILDELGV